MKKITKRMVDQYWPAFWRVAAVIDTEWPRGMDVTLKSLRRAEVLFIPISEWRMLVRRVATGPLLKHYVATRDLIDDMDNHDALAYWQQKRMYLQLIKECLCEIADSA